MSNKGLLEMNGKVPVDREIFTMVVIIGRKVAETCFMRKVGIWSRSLLLGEAGKSLAISLQKKMMIRLRL